jgi:MFS family permease
MAPVLSTYRAVLGAPGALAFTATGLVARLPISMVGLGIVLLVSERTGSYGLAGSVSAAFVLANAAVSVFVSRAVDRFGQHRVLPPAVLVHGAGLVAMMAAVEAGWGTPVPQLLAAVAGAFLPQVGAVVRARWGYVLRDDPDKRRLQTAYALEAVNDELIFIVGPTLVTLLATQAHPLAGLAAALVTGVGGTLALATLRASEPPAHRDAARDRPVERLGAAALAPMVLCGAALGMLFGGTEVATVAFTEEQGTTSWAGPLLAVWAAGSLIAGLVTGAMAVVSGTLTRFRRGLLALTLLMVPLPWVPSLWVLAVVLFLAGFAISPTLIAAASWVEETVPGERITEGMTVFTTGLVAGVAAGAWVVGVVVDEYGASAAYGVPAAAGGTATLVAALAFPRRPRAGTDSLRA